jgi:hypothetical protein
VLRQLQAVCQNKGCNFILTKPDRLSLGHRLPKSGPGGKKPTTFDFFGFAQMCG